MYRKICQYSTLKVTVSQDGFGFTVKVYIISRPSLRWHALSQSFLASYWSARFWILLQVSALASHWLEECANFTPMLEENDHKMDLAFDDMHIKF